MPRPASALLFLPLLLFCASAGDQPVASGACAPDNDGLELAEGFCAVLVGEDLGEVRHLAVAPNGDVLAARSDGGVLVLRDTTGDGRADITRSFGDAGGSGIALQGDQLYFGADDRILRYEWPAGALEPAGPPTVVVQNLPTGGHSAKGIAVRGDSLFVSIGSRTNSCQEDDRQSRSPGIDPCTELETRAGVWVFSASGEGQSQPDGARISTGLRNPMALAVNPVNGSVYAMMHGRDQLGQNWGYSDQDNAEKPAEEFVRLSAGADFGWPYCYYDPALDKLVLAPEYGGDGQEVGRCAEKMDPLLAFPAHWAPNALVFHDGTGFPDAWQGGAFIAFHGSWNRAPLPQAGYRVVFLPMGDGVPAGEYRTFATAAAGPTGWRPSGSAVGPDGSLY
ncbi:MAG: PQQ-dependent sugar dehydrogenase, partial [Gemmatimonadales bacterium]